MGDSLGPSAAPASSRLIYEINRCSLPVVAGRTNLVNASHFLLTLSPFTHTFYVLYYMDGRSLVIHFLHMSLETFLCKTDMFSMKAQNLNEFKYKLDSFLRKHFLSVLFNVISSSHAVFHDA